MENYLIDTALLVPKYDIIYKGHPLHVWESLTYIYCYIYYAISVVQVGSKRQHQVFDVTVCALKWLLPSFPVNNKELVRVKTGPTQKRSWGGR